MLIVFVCVRPVFLQCRNYIDEGIKAVERVVSCASQVILGQQMYHDFLLLLSLLFLPSLFRVHRSCVNACMLARCKLLLLLWRLLLPLTRVQSVTSVSTWSPVLNN